MSGLPLKIHCLHLPVPRRFQWRVVIILVGLYFLGNLSGVPLLRDTDVPIEPVWFWGVVTAVSAVLITFSVYLGSRTGLGAPWLEGQVSKVNCRGWFRSGLALCVLITIAGLPLSLWLNQGIDPTRYPAGWQLLLASVKAAIVEEIASRLLLVTIFVWLGSRVCRDPEGRPTTGVYWSAIILAGLMFAWSHVDANLSQPEVPITGLFVLMILGTGLGIAFGWLFWKLGLEWAIFAHFLYDAVVSVLLVPVYLLGKPWAWALFLAGAVLATVLAIRALTPDQR